MAKTDYRSVAEYIAAQPKSSQTVLKKVRSAIRAAVPKADEVISYQIAAYKLPGGPVLYFAAWKAHYSLYPATDGVIAKFESELTAYEIKKRTLRFPLDAPVPVKLIAKIAKFRAKELAQAMALKYR